MGRFIDVTVDDPAFAERRGPGGGGRGVSRGHLRAARRPPISRPEREDECLLCGLCLAAAPPAAVTVRRRYGAGRALATTAQQ